MGESRLIEPLFTKRQCDTGGLSLYMHFFEDGTSAMYFSGAMLGELWMITDPDGRPMPDPHCDRYPFTTRLARTALLGYAEGDGEDV